MNFFLELNAGGADVLRETLDDDLGPGAPGTPFYCSNARGPRRHRRSRHRRSTQRLRQPPPPSGTLPAKTSAGFEKKRGRELDPKSFGRDGVQPRARCIAEKTVRTNDVPLVSLDYYYTVTTKEDIKLVDFTYLPQNQNFDIYTQRTPKPQNPAGSVYRVSRY